MTSAQAWSWPIEQSGEALLALVVHAGLAGAQGSARDGGASALGIGAGGPLSTTRADGPGASAVVDATGRWLEHIASRVGVELEPVAAAVADISSFTAHGGPALLLLPGAGEGEDESEDAPSRLVVLLASRRGHARVLGHDRELHRIPHEQLRRRLCERIEAPARVACDRLLETAGVPAARRARARHALLRRGLSTRRVHGLWIVRLPPGVDARAQARHEGVPRVLAFVGSARFLQYALLLVAWWIIGASILAGRPDAGWLWAWALVLATAIPLRLLGAWYEGTIALKVGAALKRRLLVGALAIDADAIRSRGSGQLLAQVYESEAVEALALKGGLLSASALIDLALAAWVLWQGAAGLLHVALLALWVAVVCLSGWRYGAWRRRWAARRMALTQELVERMVGHCTRLAQEAPDRWHVDEAAALELYLGQSAPMDRRAILLGVVASRGWLLLGVVGLWPVMVSGAATTAGLAIAFGGVLLALHAFVGLAGGFVHLADLVIAWREVAPLAAAARRFDEDRPRGFHAGPRELDGNGERPAAPPELPPPAVVEARSLCFRYPARERTVLRDLDLTIRVGERVLLEGASGGGKSTLASLLVGLRQPSAGLLLLAGLDRATHGAQGWRARVAASPQFHENHVFTGTFAFNLLMGRRWPPRADDVELAERVCDELGLRPLLERMPAGMMQIVGESGWQLSHGERSRVYLARALLQGARLVVLDESVAALDPVNQARALDCAFARAPTLMMIAHP